MHYRVSPHAPPIQTKPSWALARMYATPYCSPSRSSCFFCDDTAHITFLECGVYQSALHASGLCPSEICVALRNWRVQFTATLACIVLAFALGDRLVVDKPPYVDEVRPKVVIRGKEFFVPQHFPKDASGKLEYDKNLIKEFDTKTGACFATCASTTLPLRNPHTKIRRRTSSTGACFATSYKAHVCATHICIYIYIYIYYYTPLPLNLANKQASKQASTSPFRFGHCSASSLRAQLYSSHPRA